MSLEKWTLVWSPLKPLSEENLLSIPASAGVYRLSYRANDESIYVFYSGKAVNLQQRLLEHFRKTDGNICIGKMLDNAVCYFRYALVTRENIRDGAELFLYKYYKPQCNSQEPSGPDIEINLD